MVLARRGKEAQAARDTSLFCRNVESQIDRAQCSQRSA
jgi:hypothetical protein